MKRGRGRAVWTLNLSDDLAYIVGVLLIVRGIDERIQAMEILSLVLWKLQ
jgi:hypothetical protein